MSTNIVPVERVITTFDDFGSYYFEAGTGRVLTYTGNNFIYSDGGIDTSYPDAPAMNVVLDPNSISVVAVVDNFGTTYYDDISGRPLKYTGSGYVFSGPPLPVTPQNAKWEWLQKYLIGQGAIQRGKVAMTGSLPYGNNTGYVIAYSTPLNMIDWPTVTDAYFVPDWQAAMDAAADPNFYKDFIMTGIAAASLGYGLSSMTALTGEVLPASATVAQESAALEQFYGTNIAVSSEAIPATVSALDETAALNAFYGTDIPVSDSLSIIDKLKNAVSNALSGANPPLPQVSTIPGGSVPIPSSNTITDVIAKAASAAPDKLASGAVSVAVGKVLASVAGGIGPAPTASTASTGLNSTETYGITPSLTPALSQLMLPIAAIVAAILIG